MYEFISPQNIYHGIDSLNKLPKIIEDFKVKKLTILTDPQIKEDGITDPILNQADELNIKTQEIDDVEPEPSIEVSNKILEKVRNFNPDLIIGVGGGSALDLAKSVSVLITNSGYVENYLNLSGNREITSKGIPKVLIPTTSGTGAEVTDIAVFSLETTKDIISHEYLLADY